MKIKQKLSSACCFSKEVWQISEIELVTKKSHRKLGQARSGMCGNKTRFRNQPERSVIG
jgi:hypothetical protein